MSEHPLAAAAERETAGYLRLAAVCSAEGVVRDRYARHLDLTDTMAWRRAEAAEIRLSAARAVGDRTEVGAAQEWLRQCQAEAIRACAEAVIEHNTLARARRRSDEELCKQRRRMIEAVDAASAIRRYHDGWSGRSQLPH